MCHNLRLDEYRPGGEIALLGGENSRLGQPMRHSLTQRSIDAGLPALSGGLEGFKHIGIHTHVQGRALHGSGGLPRPRLMLA